MIIDCHGHYTTVPAAHVGWREAQLAAWRDGTEAPDYPSISDEEIRESLAESQIRAQRERGIDLTLFSPTAAAMGHHLGDAAVSAAWSRRCNDLIDRVCRLFPSNFVGVCQLPQSPGSDPADCIDELERCIVDLGFVGCNLNPDVSGGHWKGPPMTDPVWFPLYEKLVELDVPAMIHISGSCNANFHTTGAHYLAADTAVFMQLIEGDLFSRFPKLRFIIPHGGGAAAYHWGRFRGLAQRLGRPELETHLLDNVFFDTCVYHQPGIDLLTKVVPADNILFATEMFGAVRGIDPRTGRHFDDTGWYVRETRELDEARRQRIFHTNALRVFPRLAAHLAERSSTAAH